MYLVIIIIIIMFLLHTSSFSYGFLNYSNRSDMFRPLIIFFYVSQQKFLFSLQRTYRRLSISHQYYFAHFSIVRILRMIVIIYYVCEYVFFLSFFIINTSCVSPTHIICYWIDVHLDYATICLKLLFRPTDIGFVTRWITRSIP